jgi:acetyltransferase-like isoleucine patch superfamily enzyme
MNFIKLKRKLLFAFVLKIPYLKSRIWALRQFGFTIGRDVYIGEGITITVGYADRSMQLVINDRASLGPNVTLIIASHPNKSKLTLPPPRDV